MGSKKKIDGRLHITIESGNAWLVLDNSTAIVEGGPGKPSYEGFGLVSINGSLAKVNNIMTGVSATGFPFVMKSDPWTRRLWPREHDIAEHVYATIKRSADRVADDIRLALRQIKNKEIIA